MISYMYQLAALTGFGQLLISKEFLPIFGDYMRFWYCFVYFIVAIANVIGLNAYLAFFKKPKLISKVFLGLVTVPAILASVFFTYNYASISSHPLFLTSAVSLETVFFVILFFDVAVLAVSLYLFFRPKWLDVTVTSVAIVGAVVIYVFLVPAWRSATFVVSAMVLGVACFAVLGAGIYVLLRLLWENLKKKKRRR